jgi:hypothetical protein
MAHDLSGQVAHARRIAANIAKLPELITGFGLSVK